MYAPVDFQLLGLHLGEDGMMQEPSGVGGSTVASPWSGAAPPGNVVPTNQGQWSQGTTPPGGDQPVGFVHQPQTFPPGGGPPGLAGLRPPGGAPIQQSPGYSPFPTDTGPGGGTVSPPLSAPSIYQGHQYPAGTVFNPQGVPMNLANIPGAVGPYQGPPTSESPYSAGGTFQSVGGIRINNPYSEGATEAYGSPQQAAAAMGINLANWTPEGNYVGPVDASGMPVAVGGHYVGPNDASIGALMPATGLGH